jgi:hypothetical protein
MAALQAPSFQKDMQAPSAQIFVSWRACWSGSGQLQAWKHAFMVLRAARAAAARVGRVPEEAAGGIQAVQAGRVVQRRQAAGIFERRPRPLAAHGWEEPRRHRKSAWQATRVRDQASPPCWETMHRPKQLHLPLHTASHEPPWPLASQAERSCALPGP